jgi:hypothetical protein
MFNTTRTRGRGRYARRERRGPVRFLLVAAAVAAFIVLRRRSEQARA